MVSHPDAVHERLDDFQARGAGISISPLSAEDLYLDEVEPVDGTKVFETFGLVYHWTQREYLDSILESGLAPGQRGGFWLTPSRYSPCLASRIQPGTLDLMPCGGKVPATWDDRIAKSDTSR